MKAYTSIHLRFPSKRHLIAALKALEPETRRAPTSRCQVQIMHEDNRLTLDLKAEDTSALRAAINSYLNWIALVKDTCVVLESL